MHKLPIRSEIVERVLARRGKYHLFEHLDPERSAFVIIDMQNTFVAPGAPAEVPASRGIVPTINAFNRELRAIGARVVWITTANVRDRRGSDWDGFFNRFVGAEVRDRTIASFAPGADGTKLWREFETGPDDLHLVKNRYSCLIPGASPLERVLRSLGVDTILIGGTKTNVCCESTGRDAMMLDFNTVMVSDCLATLTDEEHRASLETFIQQFGDVMSAEEALSALRRKPN